MILCGEVLKKTIFIRNEKTPGRVGDPGVFFAKYKAGSVLLSQKVTQLVPSALEGLTSVFGMGTGVAPPL